MVVPLRRWWIKVGAWSERRVYVRVDGHDVGHPDLVGPHHQVLDARKFLRVPRHELVEPLLQAERKKSQSWGKRELEATQIYMWMTCGHIPQKSGGCCRRDCGRDLSFFVFPEMLMTSNSQKMPTKPTLRVCFGKYPIVKWFNTLSCKLVSILILCCYHRGDTLTTYMLSFPEILKSTPLFGTSCLCFGLWREQNVLCVLCCIVRS